MPIKSISNSTFRRRKKMYIFSDIVRLSIELCQDGFKKDAEISSKFPLKIGKPTPLNLKKLMEEYKKMNISVSQ
jgi:hypothetical protein